MIKNFLKKHIGPIRIGITVSKTLLLIWLKRDLKKIEGKLGVDLAGGLMANKKFFKTNSYICVDIDKKKLNFGKSKYPDVKVVNCKIQEYLIKNNRIKPDLIVCVQTMGTNTLFNHNETNETIRLMTNHLKKNGSMIFNIGNHELNLNKLKGDIDYFLKQKFRSIKVYEYGFLNKTIKNPINSYLRYIIAVIMDNFPPLRTLFGLKKNNLYYCCKTKI